MFIGLSEAITITHHDKPNYTKLSKSTRSGRDKKEHVADNVIGITAIPAFERHKRLLPYINYYNDQRNSRIPVATQDKLKYQILLPKQGGFQLYSQKMNNPPVRQQQPPVRQQQPSVRQQQPSYKQNKIQMTPFLEVNALPGPLIPIRNNQPHTVEVTYSQISEAPKHEPDYSGLYDQLAQLKLISDTRNNQKPSEVQISFNNDNGGRGHLYNTQNFPKYETIETYTPSDIDLSNVDTDYNNRDVIPTRSYSSQLQINKFQPPKPFIYQNIATTIPQSSYPIVSEDSSKTNNLQISALKQILKEPSHGAYPVYQENIGFIPVKFVPESPQSNIQKPPPIYVQRRPNSSKKPVIAIVDENYVAQTFVPIHNYGITKELSPPNIYSHNVTQVYNKNEYQNNGYKISPVYEISNHPTNIKSNQNVEPQTFLNPPTNYDNPVSVQTEQYNKPNEDTQTFVQVLKQLLESNTLPHAVTPSNVDNNIKTLVYILDKLNDQTIAKPLPTPEQNAAQYDKSLQYDNKDNENYVGIPKKLLNPSTVIQNFPIKIHNGGTPGKAGIDYPALSTIPQTRFRCKTQRYKGFFGDPDTNCQVWHYCDLNGGQASFLCPNGTIFSQVALTCDWWYNVKCSTTTQLYVLNERLYKYILPLSPKFPEDYSGPLVDKYLAMKFQEMEEKMRQQKNKSNKSKEEKKNAEELQNEEPQDNNTETTDSPEKSNEKSGKT